MRARRGRAHPRSRGENASDLTVPPRAAGSSPLTRGKPRGNLSPPDASRLIPAHAGKTVESHCDGPVARAHPRSRGENAIAALVAGLVYGSSPLTRGKPTI